MALTNAAGTLVERYTYSAYGTLGIYAANGTVRTSSTYANRYTYTGREYDPNLNLYHFRARWYDPATGGFVSRDPLGYVDGMSLYRGYFGLSFTDPFGAKREPSVTSVSLNPNSPDFVAPAVDQDNPHKGMTIGDIIGQHLAGSMGGALNILGPWCWPIAAVPGLSVCLVATFTVDLSTCCNSRNTATQYWDYAVTVEFYGQYGASFNKHNPGRGGRNDPVDNPDGGPKIKRKHAKEKDDRNFGYRDRVGQATWEQIASCDDFGFQWLEGAVFVRGSIGAYLGAQFAATQTIDENFHPIYGWDFSGSLAVGVVGASVEIGGGGTFRYTVERHDLGTPCCVH